MMPLTTPVRQLERQESAACARADRGGHDLAGPGRALGRRLAGPGPNLRGHGQSPRFTEDQLATAPEVLLADVLTVVDAQLGPVALVGHSLGGLLALRAAVAR